MNGSSVNASANSREAARISLNAPSYSIAAPRRRFLRIRTHLVHQRHVSANPGRRPSSFASNAPPRASRGPRVAQARVLVAPD